MKTLILFLLFTFPYNSALGYENELKVHPKLKKQLEEVGTSDVLIFLEKQANLESAEKIENRVERISYVYEKLSEVSLESQRNLIEILDEENIEYRSFHIVNAIIAYSVNKKQIEKIMNSSSVKIITGDPELKLSMPPQISRYQDFSQFDISDNLKQIGVHKSWNKGFKGSGIVIAGQDSGYDWQHPSLIAQYRGSGFFPVKHEYNWHDAIRSKLKSQKTNSKCGYDLKEPCDDSGHGTHTMGTMVGFEKQSLTNPIGVAPDANWIGCRNMDQGVGKPSTYLECFEFFLAPYKFGDNPKFDGRPEYAPHIINNSWGCPSSEGCAGEEFLQAIENLQSAGIFIVASAGNDGANCSTVNTAPGFYSGKLMSVAAYDHRTLDIAFFSSRGPSIWNQGLGPNITAPGHGIRSAVPRNSGDLYDYKSGTSMSGPHVAGAIALLWSAVPRLIGKIDETTKIIEQSATKRTSSQSCGGFSGQEIPNAVFGYGIININEAIKQAR